VTLSVTTTESFGGNTSITAEISKAIKLGATFTWNTTSASAIGVGFTWPITSGKNGYIKFTPYLDVTVGNLSMFFYDYATGVSGFLDVGEVWGASPRKLPSGFTNGLYEVVEY